MKKILFLLIFLPITLFSQKPQNIILIIGDGMGFAQSSLMSTITGTASIIEQFPIIGINKTQSASDYVTDSGAGGTAIACGVKTFNGAIGVSSDSTEVKSMLEIASQKGYVTGIIATSKINHATPASFTAHDIDRDNYDAIAKDQVNSPVDLLIGGGEKYFIPLSSQMKQKGFEIKTTKDYNDAAFFKTLAITYPKIAVFVADNDAEQANKGRGDMEPNATEYALKFLDGKNKGFFIMIEGSQIDWALHNNDKIYLSAELKDFNKTVGAALDFAKKKGNTLVIVTADHETGGLSLENIDLSNGKEKLELGFSTLKHTGCWVPVLAFGPGAENFSGIYHNTDIFTKIIELYK
ncbi:MAG: alkaline phosphatase [bacterium]